MPILYSTPTRRRPQPGGAIRTLGIGLVAVAAVMVSLTFVRQRNEVRRPDPQPTPGRAPVLSGTKLDAIRTAGL